MLTFLFTLAMAAAAVYWLILREDTPPLGMDPAAAVEGARADGALPDVTFVRPAYTSATWVESRVELVVQAGAVVEQHTRIDIAADYGRGVARVEGSGVAAVDGEPRTVVLTSEHQYVPGDVFGAPWTRSPRQVAAIDTPGYLRLYQEFVTPAVRQGATGVSSADEVLAGVPVTTYRFDLDLRLLDPNGDLIPTSLATGSEPVAGRVRISFDDAGMIRLYEVRLPDAIVRDLAAAGDSGAPVLLSSLVEVTSLSGDPLDIEVPPDVVDG